MNAARGGAVDMGVHGRRRGSTAGCAAVRLKLKRDTSRVSDAATCARTSRGYTGRGTKTGVQVPQSWGKNGGLGPIRTGITLF